MSRLAPKILDHDFSTQKFNTLEEQIAALTSELSAANAIISSRDIDIANQEDDIEALKQELSTKEECLDHTEVKLRYVTGRKDAFEKSEKKTKQSLKKAQDSERTAHEEKADLQRELIAHKELVERNTATIKNLKANYDETVAEKRELAIALYEASVKNKNFTMLNMAGVRKFRKLRGKTRELQKQGRTELQKAHEEIDALRSQLKKGETLISTPPNPFPEDDGLSDDNLDRSTFLDDLVPNIDEAYSILMGHANGYMAHLLDEQRARAADQERFSAEIQCLKQKLHQEHEELETIVASRNTFQQETESVFEMFKGKIFKNDVFDALYGENDILRKDNAFLISIIMRRENSVRAAKQESVVSDSSGRLSRRETDMRQSMTGGVSLKSNYWLWDQNWKVLIAFGTDVWKWWTSIPKWLHN